MDQLSLLKKDYDALKRQLKKKREIADGVKQVLPTLEMNLKVLITTTASYVIIIMKLILIL